MKHLKTLHLLVVYEDWSGRYTKNVDIIAYDFSDALNKLQNKLPYGAELRYAKKRT